MSGTNLYALIEGLSGKHWLKTAPENYRNARKRPPAETAVKDTGQAAAELDALLPAILQSSPGFDQTSDRAFKGEL